MEKISEEGAMVLVISYKDDVEISINGVRIKLPEGDTRLIKKLLYHMEENINIRKDIIFTKR